MRTVLVIDDDAVSRTLLSKWLESAGWEVIEAENGVEGLRLASERKPDAVVCDLLMPRCNGFQVCRSIRSSSNGIQDIPIVITTSSGYPTDRRNAIEAGANQVLTKPIRAEHLLAALDSKSRPPDSTAPEVPAPPVPDNLVDQPSSPRPLQDSDKSLALRFWGVRGSIPTPGYDTAGVGGNTSCVELRADGELIVLDSGTGVRPLGLSLIEEYGDHPIKLTLLLTHTHWDHIQGFPFFIPAYNPRNDLRVIGFEGVREGLSSTLSHQMESPYFPIGMQEMPSYIRFDEANDLNFKIGPVRVSAMFVNHPGVCVGYRLNCSAGSVCFIPDNESFQRQKNTAFSDRDDRFEEILAYARHQDEKLIEFVRGVDVLIMDAQYDATEYPDKVGWGHTCVDDTVAIALKAGVRKLYLFHHDPGHKDDHVARMEAHARDLAREAGSDLEIEAAREGTELHLHQAATQPRSRVGANATS